MAQITSREELEQWLRDKPIDWAQVIAVRAALRITPIALRDTVSDNWIRIYLLYIFRSLNIAWTVQNFPEHDLPTNDWVRLAAKSARASYAYRDISPDADPDPDKDPDSEAVGRAAAYAGYAAASDISSPDYANAHTYTQLTVDNASRAFSNDILLSVAIDCRWLDDLVNVEAPARRLTRRALWPVDFPDEWVDEWQSATTRLLTLDPTFQVWIDWYNRRIEGHDEAFDIPGDIDRTHDKAVLARLADATHADFWGKGATYVNTTLQGWIDDARIEARVEDILRKLRSGASAHYGTPEDLAGRAALLDELDRLLGKSPQARHGIGGNYPPEPIGPPPQPLALPEEMREPLEALSTELEKREPDALVVVEKVKLTHRVAKKLEKMADIASDEFAKSVGGELGKRIVQGAFWLALISKVLDWLAPLIHISG